MISRGPDGHLHTWRCSARNHYRLGGRGVLCLARELWSVVPARLRAILGAAALVLLAFVTGALAMFAVWWLFGGVLG